MGSSSTNSPCWSFPQWVGEKPTFIWRVKGLTKQMNMVTGTEARILSRNNGRASSQALRSIVYIENWSSYSTAFSIYYNGFPQRTLLWNTLLVRFILFHYAWYRSYKTECLCVSVSSPVSSVTERSLAFWVLCKVQWLGSPKFLGPLLSGSSCDLFCKWIYFLFLAPLTFRTALAYQKREKGMPKQSGKVKYFLSARCHRSPNGRKDTGKVE